MELEIWEYKSTDGGYWKGMDTSDCINNGIDIVFNDHLINNLFCYLDGKGYRTVLYYINENIKPNTTCNFTFESLGYGERTYTINI